MPQFDFLAKPKVADGDDPVWHILESSLDLKRAEPTPLPRGLAERTTRAYLDIVHRTHSYDTFLSRQKTIVDALELSAFPAVVQLPTPCAWLEFEFKFAKPFLTRDDPRMYLHDNPIRKDPVFRMPVIPGSTWKGCLRSAAVERMVSDITDAGLQAARRLQILRLFGDEKGTDETPVKPDSMAGYLNLQPGKNKFQEKNKALRRKFDAQDQLHLRGRLHCLPSEAWEIDADIINPRDNDGRGTVPIYLEVVPPGALSRLSLLYVPLDLFSVADPSAEIKGDFARIGEMIHDLFLFTGVGAKRTSGYGLAKPEIEKVRSPWDKVNQVHTFDELRNALASLPSILSLP